MTERLAFDTIPLHPPKHELYQYELVEYLIGKGYWEPKMVGNPRWLHMAHFSRRWIDGDTLLYREFSSRGDEWIRWSEDKPKLAAFVWPLVLEWLRRDDSTSDFSDAQSEAESLLFWARDVSNLKELCDLIQHIPELQSFAGSIPSAKE